MQADNIINSKLFSHLPGENFYFFMSGTLQRCHCQGVYIGLRRNISLGMSFATKILSTSLDFGVVIMAN
jgi:hypothetical protein